MRISDWSSDVCSSDLVAVGLQQANDAAPNGPQPDNRDPQCIFTRHHISRSPNDGVLIAAPRREAKSAAAAIRREAELMEPAGFGRRRSAEHTSEIQSLMRNSYADVRLKKKNRYIHT